MDKFDKIHEFAEGNLKESQEKELLSELLLDDELRRELRQILSVNTALKNNKKLFDVPTKSKAAIFGALGIAGGAEVIATASGNALTGVGGWVAGIWSKLALPFITGAAVAVSSAILFLIFHDVFGFVEKSELEILDREITELNTNLLESKSINNQLLKQIASLNTENEELSSELSDKINNPEIKYIVKTIEKPIYITDNEAQSEYLANSNDDFLNDESLLPLSNNLITANINSMAYDKLPIDNNYSKYEAINNSNLDQFNTETESLFNNHISLELRRYQDWHLPGATIDPTRYQDFNNMGIILSYNFSDNFSFTGEVRRENFFQDFSGVDDHGQKVSFEQQPNFTTYSLGVNYLFEPIYNFRLGLSGSIGGNRGGIVPRGGANLRYYFTNELGLSVNAEWNGLIYQFDNQGFMSNKLGISYGIIYNFK